MSNNIWLKYVDVRERFNNCEVKVYGNLYDLTSDTQELLIKLRFDKKMRLAINKTPCYISFLSITNDSGDKFIKRVDKLFNNKQFFDIDMGHLSIDGIRAEDV